MGGESIPRPAAFHPHTISLFPRDAMSQPKVTIQMRAHAGVVGEDRKDWLGGEVHTCTPAFARHLEQRGLANIIDPENMPAKPTAVAIDYGDPVREVQHGDPSVTPGGGSTLLSEANAQENAQATAPETPRRGRGGR